MDEAEAAGRIRDFEQRFGRLPRAGARAPGRVNLIGEHTDYNEGLVLPCAIDRDTLVLAARRDDGRVRVHSREAGETRELAADEPAAPGAWTAYVWAALRALAEAGAPPGGLDLAIASDVPVGSGLSSSAALEVALVTALDALFGLGLGAEARARLAHRAETAFVGVACGIMDPFASALGRRGCALRIDCRSGEATPVAIAGGRLAILIADSGVRRELASAGYGDRRAECEAAFAAARAAGLAPRGATALRDLTPDQIPVLERELPPRVFRRARHVITENARVDAVCDALAAGALGRAGALLREGQRSLRDDFEVSTPELDALCELADAQPGVFGSRLTGAGFGGCSVHLVEPEAAVPAGAALAEGFARRFGRRPAILRAEPSDGASALALD